jgi:hypothetical protein
MLEFWNDYLHVAFDPAHIAGELTFTLVFDGLVLAILVPLFRMAIKNLRKSIHTELDEEHGIEPHE